MANLGPQGAQELRPVEAEVTAWRCSDLWKHQHHWSFLITKKEADQLKPPGQRYFIISSTL